MAVDITQLSGYVDLLRYCKTEKARLNEIEKNTRSIIEETLDAARSDEGLIDGQPAVKRKRIKRSAISVRLVKELHPDVAAECTETTEVCRFEVID